jgi:hypothetical protein
MVLSNKFKHWFKLPEGALYMQHKISFIVFMIILIAHISNVVRYIISVDLFYQTPYHSSQKYPLFHSRIFPDGNVKLFYNH